jgi:N-methylhydantoinase A
MVEIGAGGGSIATIDTAGRLQVGPQSAGSEPGPAAYGRGGTKPTVTDADLVLGRIDPIGFAGGRLPLDKLASAAALLGLGCWGGDAESAALGVSEIVDETMAGAARVHINEQGAALDGRSIIAFGGAAPLHAARIAEKLGIDQVIIPPSAGVGSAVGFLRAPISYEIARSKLQRLNALEPNAINDLLTEMANEAHAIVGMGAPEAGRIEERLCFARYVGQGYEIPVPLPSRPIMAEDQFTLQQAFEAAYRDLYGGVTINLPIEILTWRVTVRTETKTIFQPRVVMNRQRVQPTNTRTVIDSATGKELKFSIYAREHLKPGDCFDGPALVTEMETTSVIGPSFAAHIDAFCNIVMDYHREAGRQ